MLNKVFKKQLFVATLLFSGYCLATVIAPPNPNSVADTLPPADISEPVAITKPNAIQEGLDAKQRQLEIKQLQKEVKDYNVLLGRLTVRMTAISSQCTSELSMDECVNLVTSTPAFEQVGRQIAIVEANRDRVLRALNELKAQVK